MDNTKKAEQEPAPKEKSNLFSWVDAGMKVIIALVGVSISYLGYSFQREFSQSQLLVQLEKGDTEIRAQMFGKITDRLMKPKSENDDSVLQDTLLVQVLALNFHELIELKPLMIDLAEQLDSRIKEIEKKIQIVSSTNLESSPSKIETLETEKEVKEKARRDLVSSARRIRDRQVSTLIHPFQKSASTDIKSGSIYYISVLRKGKKETNRCSVDDQEGKNGCLGEIFEIKAPSGKYSIYLSIDKAEWEKERFYVTLNASEKKMIPQLPAGGIIRKVEECNEELTEGIEKQTSIQPWQKEFWVTWFDFPFTDNTVLPDGQRYGIYIDEICQEARKKNDANAINGPNAVRLAVLFFPEDYYPSRERPVSSKQIRDKLDHLKEE